MSIQNAISSPQAGKHAIVHGGSMAGLIVAGVLSRHFERVTLVERDRFEEGPQPRKGIPQAPHVHVLLLRGLGILCNTFPGFREELRAAGSQSLDMSGDYAWFMAGIWRSRKPCGIRVQAQSRPLLEWTVRKCLLARSNVRVLDGREVIGYTASADNARITGVQIQAPGGGQEETLQGELVVDASGRGSRLPQWLEALGYPRVEETRIHVDVGYGSRFYRRPPGFEPGWRGLILAPDLPKMTRFGTLIPIEDDRWLASMGSWLGNHPPTDDAGFLEFARGLGHPHMYEALRNAEPLGPISLYRFSHNQRRYYERMPRFPEGLAVIGDAFCSFNPMYGQGMTTGALQAEALGECLRQGLAGVSQHYRQRVGKLLEVPWMLATSADLRLPSVEGKRPPAFGLMNWYGDRFQQLAGYDDETLRLFVEVMNMVQSPAAMFSPRTVLKVLTSRPSADVLSRRPEPMAAQAQRTQTA
ncbi:hypothetical protein F0U60_31880 [Archangium minus]|uniref:Secreted protein n=1 Tax=Archangium minus TaxID=83450 RepID=A0ABY9WYI7_9BACT|nr:hypothetical protein F0U60_31880 [Archangium minus]